MNEKRYEKRYLYVFLADLGIEISNNCAENAIRPFVVGRKNWLLSASPKGTGTSDMFYSLKVISKMSGLNAENYLVYLRPGAALLNNLILF